MVEYSALRSKAAEIRALAETMRRASDDLLGMAGLFESIADRLEPSEPPPQPRRGPEPR
jgi:hypothetical protein